RALGGSTYAALSGGVPAPPVSFDRDCKRHHALFDRLHLGWTLTHPNLSPARLVPAWPDTPPPPELPQESYPVPYRTCCCHRERRCLSSRHTGGSRRSTLGKPG